MTSVLVAWQSGLALLALDEAAAKAGAQKVITQRLGSPELDFYARVNETRTVRAAFLALSPEQRTAATQALGTAAKALVLSAPFRAAWEAEVNRRGGFNHGLSTAAPPPPQSAEKVMDEVKKTMLGSRVKDAQQFAKNKPMPANALQIIMDVDVSMISSKDSMMVASPAAQKAALARYAEAKRMLASDPVAAQKAILDAKLLAAGLEAGSGGVEQATAKGSAMADPDAKRRQQELWNKRLLAQMLREQLQRLVQTAPTVDFAAGTQMKDKKLVFVNPAYERKSLDWKLLYCAGKGPTMAAVALAQQVLAELK